MKVRNSLVDAVVSTHTVSCKYALLFDLEVSKGVNDLDPPLSNCIFFLFVVDESNI